MEIGEIAQNVQYHRFLQCFSMQSLSENHLKATFQLSSAASLNLGHSQNGIQGNGLIIVFEIICCRYSLESSHRVHTT